MAVARRHIVVGALVLAVVAGLAALLSSAHCRVQYHRWRMVSEFNTVLEIGPQSDQHPHIKAFEKHRDALVCLGYFQKDRIPLKSISVPSERSRALFLCLNGHLDIRDVYFEMPGYEPDTPDEVVIWATPEKMQVFRRIVEEHEEGRDCGQAGECGGFPGHP